MSRRSPNVAYPNCQRPTSCRGKKAISQSDCSPIHAIVTLLYRTRYIERYTVNAIWYDTGIIRRTW